MDNPKSAALSEPLAVAPDAPRRSETEPGRPIYPVDRSFILEVHRDATFADSGCIGRAEHIASGAAIRFSDASDLLHFVAATVLGAAPEDPAEATGAEDPNPVSRS